MAVASTFTTMDPYDANDTLSQAVVKSFYQGLFGFDKDMKLQNVLAESYDVSKDGLTYTIKLRKGIKFHDGTDFKSDAVKANFDRVTNPENKLKRFSLFSTVAKTEVVDDYTARVTLKKPFSAFVNVLAHPSSVMISPTALKKYGSKDIAFNPVGTGPFLFVEWKQTDHLKVKKNPNYWKPGLPKVDAITWKPVVDNNSRAAMLQTGEAHFTFPVPYEQAELLKAKADWTLVAAPSIVHRYMSMNVTKKPFDNLKVRQAINYAINKEALVKVAFNGYAFPAEGVAPQGVDYAVKMAPWPYDVAKAKQLLAEAGYPERLRDRALVRLQPHHGPEGDPVPAAAAGAGGDQGQDPGPGGRAAGPDGGRGAGSGSGRDPAVLRGLVLLHGRGRLGAPAPARVRVLAAAALQHGLLQEREGGRQPHQGAGGDGPEREGTALPGGAGADLE